MREGERWMEEEHDVGEQNKRGLGRKEGVIQAGKGGEMMMGMWRR